MDTELKQKYSLKKLSYDGRDIKYGSIFGSIPTPTDLPAVFSVGNPLFWKNQYATDYCSTFAGTEVSEDQEEIELDPIWQFMKAKQIEGDLNDYGCDLRSVAQSFLGGSIEQKDSPYSTGSSRSFILNPQNWKDKDYDTLAQAHKKQGYAFVTGEYDLFDNVRTAMYHAQTVMNVKQSVLFGMDWCLSYNTAPNGVVSQPDTPFGGHAVKLLGWKVISGETYIVAQLSQGQDFGDRGYMYFSRDVINAQEGYGAVIFLPFSKNQIQLHVNAGVPLDSNAFVRWGKILISLLKKLYGSI